MDEDGKLRPMYCIYCGKNTEIAYRKILLGHTVGVYDAEIIGATEVPKVVITHTKVKYATNIVVCSIVMKLLSADTLAI